MIKRKLNDGHKWRRTMGKGKKSPTGMIIAAVLVIGSIIYTILQSIYDKIQIIVEQIQSERFDEAIINYMMMVYGLKRQEKTE